MRKLEKIRKFPHLEWKNPVDAPQGIIVLVFVENGTNEFYTELAWKNDFGEWVDIPHYHKVRYWTECPSIISSVIENS